MAEKLAWLRLGRTENVGPITFFQLLQHYGSAEAALAALPELAARGGRRRRLKVMGRAAAEAELEAYERLGARLIAWTEPEYPDALAEIPDPPPVISALGNPHLLQRRAVAVVGARNASANGRMLARQIAAGLGGDGFCVVSGLARGIDAAAHTAATDTGTVAVFAGGIDVVYPKENQALFEKILAQGAVIAENPPGTEPQARHFPRRNRLISGLSLGVCVVEAAARSGSLITARLALEQGREVFAVPGSPLDPRCRGTNDLIRNGAVLCESAADIVEALAGQVKTPAAEPEAPGFVTAAVETPSDEALALARRRVAEALSPTPVSVDELIRACGTTPSVAWTVLLELELAGRLERHPGNRVSLLMAAPDAADA
ncbi:MAG: DNA-processing protein DprA [Kiloniellales bacterium]